MGIKCLLLNLNKKNLPNVANDISVACLTIKEKPTLHDYHALIMDTDFVFDTEFWGIYSSGMLDAMNFTDKKLKNYGLKVKELVETGGIVFLFCGPNFSLQVYSKSESGSTTCSDFSNYLFSPIALNVVSEKGDTFYPKYEELKYYNSLIKKFNKEDITWKAYFTDLPEKTKILGVNRAGYAVFAEVPIGNGKLVLLPRFKDMQKAISILITDILPQMIHEVTGTFVPQWLESYTSEYERNIKTALGNIEKNKRLLYTKDKALKKAVAFALEALGFEVKVLPDGTNADLEISDNEQNAICEVKGHENRQTNRDELLQLLGYSTPDGKDIKSIFISNHEFSKNPQERSKDAFTQGATILGVNNKLSLISAQSLYGIVMDILQGNINENSKADLRKKILNGQGIVQLT